MSLSRFLPKKFGSRLFWMTFIAGIIPVGIFTVLLGIYEREFRPQVQQTIKQVYEEEWSHSENLFQESVWTLIQQKAVGIATELDLMLQSHPYMTLEDLQGDVNFHTMAVQTVGRTGYTSLHDSFSGIIRFHTDRNLENKAPARVKQMQPSFWLMVEKSLGRNHASGYYTLVERDGSTQRMYIYIVPLEQTTADNIYLSVAVTASVDEFTRPIAEAQAVHRRTAEFLSNKTDTFFRFLRKIGLLYMGVGVLITSLIAFFAGRFFSRAITGLRKATQEVNRGNFNITVQSPMSGEIRTLIEDFNRMVRQLDVTTVSKARLEDSEARLIESNYGLQHEVNTRLLAEKALEAEKERLAVTLGSIGDGVIATDIESKILLMNNMAERLTGWTAGEAKGRYFTEIFSGIDKETGAVSDDAVTTILKGGTEIRPEKIVLLSDRNKQEKIIALSGAPIRDKGQTVQGAVIVFRDITEKLKMEDELLRTRKLESVSTLAGGVAHDFNNLLAVILGNISFARMLTDPSSKAYERLADAEDATLKGKELTYKLLTFSRVGESSKTVTSLEGIIRDSARLALADCEIQCSFVFSPNLLHVRIDEDQMRQVIYNIVTNGRETMSNEGQIEIASQNVDLDNDGVIPLPKGSYVKISITDHGSGIPATDMSRIFDPYFTTKQMGNIKGTGLGLAICHSIIKDHDGFMAVDSKPGTGTTVHVYVPAYEEESTGSEAEKNVETRPRILYMDDEDAILQVAQELLEHAGYEVKLARHGEEAVRVFSQALTAGTPFDIVIVDLTIPHGMGGTETIEKLRELDPTVKAIVTSGDTDDPVIINFKEAGFSGIILKPFHLQQVIMAIESALADRPKVFSYPFPR